MDMNLGNGLVRGEVRRITKPFETKIGMGSLVMIQLKVDDRVVLIDKDIDSSEGRVFVAPEGLLNLGVQIFVSIPPTCVMNRFEIAKMEGREIHED